MIANKLEGIQAVIFDLGDTLYVLPYSIEAYHIEFLKRVLGGDFKVLPEELEKAHDAAEIAMSKLIDDTATGPNYTVTQEDWVVFDRVLLKNLGVKENLDEKAHAYQRLWDDLLKSAPNVLREGANEVLQELANRGYKMGIATNWIENPHDLLVSSGVRHIFQSLQWTIIKGYSKPSPYMLIMNAQELGVNPLRCAFVGNKIDVDVEAARRAGMKPILLSQAHETDAKRDDLLMIKNLDELLDYLPPLELS